MKKISKIIKPSLPIDYGVFVAFILLNLIFAFAYSYARLLIADWIEQMDIFPHDYPPSDFFRISSLSWLTAECIIGALIAPWAGMLIKEWAIWIWSVPIQLILLFVLYLVLGASVGVSIEISIRIGIRIFISQAIGVAIGLLIRKLRARTKTPKPWWAN